MSDGNAGEPVLPDDLLGQLAQLSAAEGAALLQATGRWNADVVWELATVALESAERMPAEAGRWLRLARRFSAEIGTPARLDGQIAYAEARVAVQQGDLVSAEVRLRRAQELWASVGEEALLARSRLGLTQVLAMQGRYVEAEAANRAAVEGLAQAAGEPAGLILLARAYRNLATLYVMQDRHAAAVPAYLAARAALAQIGTVGSDPEIGAWRAEAGHLALNIASAYTFLGEYRQAESELLAAIGLFEEVDDDINRARAAANLGRLYSRAGDYAAALRRFDEAARALERPAEIGLDTDDGERSATARLSDELRLERALTYLALNLLPEAAAALEQCAQEFGQSGQPYELAQTRYAQGALETRRRDWEAATGRLGEALEIYRALGNRYWINRASVALADVALLRGESSVAQALLGTLPDDVETDRETGALLWDRALLVEAWLLLLRIRLAQGEIAGAVAAEAAASDLLRAYVADTVRDTDVQFPHLVLALMYSRGVLARAQGDPAGAMGWFELAADLLEAQRRTLPADELRTAFLDDKMAIYADWVAAILDRSSGEGGDLALAFGVVERARARALLERLLASLQETSATGQVEEVDRAETAQLLRERESVRRRLSDLYDSLLGLSDSRGAAPRVFDELARYEQALQVLEWRSGAVPVATVPARVEELQATLPVGRRALVYFVAHQEVMVFIVSSDTLEVVRHLCGLGDVGDALRDLRFQLGRMELEDAHVAQRLQHYKRGVTQVLARLYRLLIAPVANLGDGGELLILPYGTLHAVPFHALWDGNRYLIEGCDIAYAPSAAFLVHRGRSAVGEAGRSGARYGRFAGFAPVDATIPAAKAEVLSAAEFFPIAQSWLGEEATTAALQSCAAHVDVLHLATHGLFRLDNPFFSALKLSDGWLDVREIQRLRFSAGLVVLSACESGAGRVRGGDEVIGLARGFMAAGARHVVASLWNVHDRSAVGFMREFYRALMGRDCLPATALGVAQRGAIAEGIHPYYWAPFVAVGGFDA